MAISSRRVFLLIQPNNSCRWQQRKVLLALDHAVHVLAAHTKSERPKSDVIHSACLVVVFVHGRHSALVSDPDIHSVRVIAKGLDGQTDAGRHFVK